jgi:uncharacterized protein YbjT (DUF2867 family)
MAKTVIVAGATGLVGSSLISQLIENKEVTKIIALSRKQITITDEKIENLVIDFDNINEVRLPPIDAAFCALGSTIKKAGSQAAFYKMDFTYPLHFAQLALAHRAKKFHLVSAMGADKDSFIFYNRVKGELEEAISALPFEAIHIYRPSLLVGARNEKRIGEDIGKVINAVFGFLIPKNYKAIEGSKVAAAMCEGERNAQKGKIIHFSGEMNKAVV